VRLRFEFLARDLVPKRSGSSGKYWNEESPMSNTGNTQQIIDYGAQANDGTGDPLRTAFIKTDENFSNIWRAGPVGSNITITNNTVQVNNTNGNLVLKPNGTGAIRANGSIIPDLDQVRDLGSSNLRFRSLYFGGDINSTGNLSVNNLNVLGNLDLENDVVINGNLTVNGNTVTVNVANLEITDKTIVIAKGTTPLLSNNAGITVDTVNANIFYTFFNDSWNVNKSLIVEENLTVTDQITSNRIVTGEITSNRLTAGSESSRWDINGSIFAAPTGAAWFSDQANKDDYIYSADDGYLNFYTYDTFNNLQSEIKMEHGIIRIKIHNGPDVEWDFDEQGNLTVPGNIIPRAGNSYSLGNSTNQWGELWVAGNTIYIGGVPLGITGNVLTVAGEPVLSNDSDSSIITTGNIAANYFIGDGSLLTGTPSGATGPVGPTGPAGADGATGPQGPAGATGATGPKGEDGTIGVDGATGATGPQGVAGATGATGTFNGILTANLDGQGFNISNVSSVASTGNITATRLQNDANLEIRSNLAGTLKNWTFDTLGDLNLPAGGNISGSGGISANNITLTGSVNTGGNLNFTSAEASDTARIFAEITGSDTSMVLEVGDDDADAIVLRHYSFAASNTIDMLRAQRSSNTEANVTVTGNISATGNVTGGNLISSATIYGNVDVVLGNIANASAVKTRIVSDTDFSYIQTGNGTVGSTGNIVFSPYSDPTQRVVIDTSSGNVTAGNITLTGNVVAGSAANVDLVAGSNTWSFNNAGNLVLPGNTFAVNYANGTPVTTLSNTVNKTTGSWTVTTGTNNYSFTVPDNGVYQLWVRGNIPNGIITYTATVSVTNSNVPVIGQQFAWNYEGAGSPILFTSIPSQIIGTAGAISNASPSVGTTTNTFVFGINNSSGGNVTVEYGYTTIS
jgi:hypothetical protein